MESSHLFANKTDLLKECYRLLKPSGRILLCDLTLGPDVQAPIDRQLLKLIRSLRSAFGPVHPIHPTYYMKLLSGAGFFIDLSLDISHEVKPTAVAWEQNLQANRVNLVHEVGEQVVNALEEGTRIVANLLSSGQMGYHIFYASAVKEELG